MKRRWSADEVATWYTEVYTWYAEAYTWFANGETLAVRDERDDFLKAVLTLCGWELNVLMYDPGARQRRRRGDYAGRDDGVGGADSV